jgi:anti-sigma regulatory factor (Ser/Thr protein kinase)
MSAHGTRVADYGDPRGPMNGGTLGETRAERLAIRLAADPVGVPGARRFVVDATRALGREQLADAAELCVSELAGNAALHSGASFMDVAVTAAEPGVLVEVEDDGAVAVEAVQPTTLAGDSRAPQWQVASTGRGLAIVSMVASQWGSDPTPGGKRVWAQITDPDDVNEVRPPAQTHRPAPPAVHGQLLPPGWVSVRLAACPVQLSLRQDQHLDELVRELQLMVADRSSDRSQELATRIRGLLHSPGAARATGRRTAQLAAAKGQTHVDIDMAMPAEFSTVVQELHRAVDTADQLCQDNRLLALSSPADVRALRTWMTEELVGQIDHRAAPRPWPQWVRDQPVDPTSTP